MTEKFSEINQECWPVCKSEQTQVMLLGTFHMDNLGLDEVNVDVGDVLSNRRQTELEALVDQLADWKPQRVAVERPYNCAEEVNDRYEEYRSGNRDYDREEEFPTPHSMHNGEKTECRSEVVQVGYRLADHLDHLYVASIDEHPDESQYNSTPFEDRDIDSSRKTSVTPKDTEQMQKEQDERLASSTISEYLAWINQEDNLRDNHDIMFDRGIRATGEPFGSPTALAYWYDRNIRMVHHLWRSMMPGDNRILLLVGSGHIRALRHLLNEAPMFCPVSPMSYLSNGE